MLYTEIPAALVKFLFEDTMNNNYTTALTKDSYSIPIDNRQNTDGHA